MANHELGIVGLATMGQNLARNLASRGVRVSVYNRTRQRTDEFMADHGREGDFRPVRSLEELVRTLARPQAVLLMVKAGSPVDEAIESLSKLLEPGDLIIDGGQLAVPRHATSCTGRGGYRSRVPRGRHLRWRGGRAPRA